PRVPWIGSSPPGLRSNNPLRLGDLGYSPRAEWMIGSPRTTIAGLASEVKAVGVAPIWRFSCDIVTLLTAQPPPAPGWTSGRGAGEEARRDVALARVGQQHHDQLAGGLRARGHRKRRVQRRARRDAGDDPLFPRQPPGAVEGRGIRDRDDLVQD